MKKLLRLFSLLFLITIIFIGCTSDKNNAKKVAQELGRNLYTVDAKKVAEYKTLDAAPIGDIIGTANENGEVRGPSKEYIKIMQSLNKNIQPLMTKRAYEVTEASRYDLLITEVCARGGYTSKVTDFILTKESYDKKNNTAKYDYEVKLKVISTDGKVERTDVAKGDIGLIKEDGKWKMSSYSITEYPQLYKDEHS